MTADFEESTSIHWIPSYHLLQTPEGNWKLQKQKFCHYNYRVNQYNNYSFVAFVPDPTLTSQSHNTLGFSWNANLSVNEQKERIGLEGSDCKWERMKEWKKENERENIESKICHNAKISPFFKMAPN